MLAAALDCIVTIDQSGNITEFNPAAERLFGYSKEEVLGREMAEVIVPPALREPHRRGMARFLATGEARVIGRRIEITAMRSDGSELPVELTITQLPVDGPPMFTGFIRDLTQQKEHEAALRQQNEDLEAMNLELEETVASAEAARRDAHEANRAKSLFLATMSHELRTPLNAIAGYAQLLEEGIRGPLTAEQLEDLARIQRSQEHLATLVNDILDFSTLEVGRVQLRRRPTPLDGAVAAARDLFAATIANEGLHGEWRLRAEGAIVEADESRLRQIISNLVSNAVKFTDPGGSIVVTTWADASQAHVSVSDSGVGIPADKLEEIFQPFLQLDATLSRRSGGVGLGLAISRDLARAMGGDLQVRSTPGQGSTFELTLPISREHSPVSQSG